MRHRPGNPNAKSDPFARARRREFVPTPEIEGVEARPRHRRVEITVAPPLTERDAYELAWLQEAARQPTLRGPRNGDAYAAARPLTRSSA